MPEPYLDAATIRASTFIRHVEIHDTLGSTNDRAAELACDSEIALPALVAARHQSAGRGRGNNKWLSTGGALTFSLLLDPASLGICTVKWPQLSLTTAVAICNALAMELIDTEQRAGASSPPFGLEDQPARFNSKSRLAIKWPNDIMLDGAKLAGILIESPGGSAPAKDRLILGIGINVNNSMRGAPPELASSATSLSDASAREHSQQDVLVRLLNELQSELIRLERNEPALPRAWQGLCCLTGQNVSVQLGQRTVGGICTGIADDGALLLKTASTTERIYSGSLRNS